MLLCHVFISARMHHSSKSLLNRISAYLLRSKPCISQLLEELVGESRIDKFQKLGNLLPVLREMQDERVFVRIRSNVTVCCTRRMHNTCMRIYIMHFCVNGDLIRCQSLRLLRGTILATLKFLKCGII